MTLDVASRNRLSILNALQGAQWSIEGQEVICRCAVGTATSLEGDGATILVHDRTARTSPTGSSIGLVVAGIEIAISFSVFGGVSVESADDARKNTEFFACIVTDDSDLDTNCMGQLA